MWRKPFYAVALGLALMLLSPPPPAQALLIDGSYRIHLTGNQIDPSDGRFTVSGGTIQNFRLDLLSGGVPANTSSRYSGGPNSLFTLTDDSMFTGSAFNTYALPGSLFQINFSPLGTWACLGGPTSRACASSGGLLEVADGIRAKVSGDYRISIVPLPGAIWLFLTALGGLGLVGRGNYVRRRIEA